MLNQVVLVGRLTGKQETVDGIILTMAIPRPYKNDEGVYDTDYLPVIVKTPGLKEAIDSINKGDLIGIKGRIEGDPTPIAIVAEKITFLSSKKA